MDEEKKYWFDNRSRITDCYDRISHIFAANFMVSRNRLLAGRGGGSPGGYWLWLLDKLLFEDGDAMVGTTNTPITASLEYNEQLNPFIS
jgi:hypothetical protein